MELLYSTEKEERLKMPAPASCVNTEHGCVMFDCLVHLWEWIDPPPAQSQYQMEDKKSVPATQQPLTQQHIMAHHVHPDQIYAQQNTQIAAHINNQPGQMQLNGGMHQHMQNQYHANMNARSPLLENRHELYGTGHSQEYNRHYGANDNYNYPQSPPRFERTDFQTDQNVNHELLHNIPKGYNAEVYQDYLKRNPPKDSNQIYQNHQPMYRPNVNQYGSKPYLPYSNRIGPQSNTELLRRQYNEIQQMKMQQQMHYQNQAQMHQQQKFAERQLLLQQIHGVQPPPNLQNSIYSDSSYRDLDRYSSKNDFKEYSNADINKDINRYSKENDFIEIEKHRQYQDAQWQTNQNDDFRETSRHRNHEDVSKTQSPPEFSGPPKKNNAETVSPMKSSESSTPSIKSPSSESRRSSSGTQALRSPIAQRIPSAPVTMAGILYKQGSDGLKVWRKRWFVLSEYCLFYYKSQEEEKLLGSVLLPSYRVSACTAEDKVMRKFAFKLEHANMRTYVLAALDQEAMLKWVKMLTMAALMQNPNDQRQNQSDRTAAKTEDDEETPGPTYANAPPKPRRSNDGYSSPSPDMYDPNYDLLKQPASHYSQGANTRYQDTQQESTYIRSPQTTSSQPQQHTKRPYDMNLSLPLTNITKEKLENQQNNPYKSNPNSPYIDNRSKSHHEQIQQDNRNEAMYEKQKQYNPFLQDYPAQGSSTQQIVKENNLQSSKSGSDVERGKALYAESYTNAKPYTDPNVYAKDHYGELNATTSKQVSSTSERMQQMQEAYGRTVPVPAYKTKMGDYEDIYAEYGGENQYGKTYVKSPITPQHREVISMASHKSPQDQQVTYPQEKVFSGPSVLRRKKMQASGIQPQMPRPHSADFLEYEMKNESSQNTATAKVVSDLPRQPQRPKSSLDINSYYDPSSDRYYSEESYAEKMRRSAQYLQQQGVASGNIQIPLAKYASGLVEKQLHSPYSQATNNNYETGFGTSRSNKDNISYNSKYSDLEGIHSNWTLKEKDLENQKLRSGSVISDNSNMSIVKDAARIDTNADGFIRSASARIPSSNEREGEKKIQQREESMKRLLEWKQRMLQSPLTRKSTPATISLARSLNQSRQSLRSDQYKSKTYANASYNSYSSDDEEETSDTGLQIPKDMQAGRSHLVNVMIPTISRPITSHVLTSTSVNNSTINDCPNTDPTENIYENISCSPSISQTHIDESIVADSIKYESDAIQAGPKEPDESETEFEEINCDGYETHDSEAESETQNEYTDNDLDEVLLASDLESEQKIDPQSSKDNEKGQDKIDNKLEDKSETPPIKVLGEDHYLPMSPRKMSTIEPAHKTILDNITDLDNYLPHAYEDNPYVEMALGNDEDDMQTYELVCINNDRPEPVYMELSYVVSEENKTDGSIKSSSQSDSASNFADTKEHTLKRGKDKNCKEKVDTSDADDDVFREVPLDEPYSRFSISDTFRPASYYLSGSSNTLNRNRSSDSDITPLPPLPNSSPPCDGLMDEELSKYILDKLDKSDLSQDNSIIKMLTCENQKMHKIKKKTTSLMIYGSHTSIHDTLSRGEKIRNSRASLTNVRNKLSDTANDFLNDSIPEIQNSSSVDAESLQSYNADRGSSRLSLESDVSSRFENMSLNFSSDVRSLTDVDSSIDLRQSIGSVEYDDTNKRRPLSDDSLFSLSIPEHHVGDIADVNLDLFLESLQPGTSQSNFHNKNLRTQFNRINTLEHKENVCRTYNQDHQSVGIPIEESEDIPLTLNDNRSSLNSHNTFEDIVDPNHNCLNPDAPSSPFSFYCKSYSEDSMHRKNLNHDVVADKIKEFENEKNVLKNGMETNDSSTTTGFHSRESSGQSAPYYYSDLSSQEHINAIHTSQFLKNTNLHRKLNNQRRRGPSHKKNDISHIHNPIHNNQFTSSDRSFDLVASARSVSVEFLSAVEKNPEFDLRNIYESTGANKVCKIPESINLIPSLLCKKYAKHTNMDESSLSESNALNNSSPQTSAAVKISRGSMSSHCSENSSNTVYYDAEAEAGAYENIMFTGDSHWDENALWQDNLRRISSHRHARSMDDLDTVENSRADRSGTMNSIKRVKNSTNKICRNVTYVNCDIQEQVQRRLDGGSGSKQTSLTKCESNDDHDVYVSLANTSQISNQPNDEGIYEQLAVGSTEYMHTLKNTTATSRRKEQANRRRFEIDRENLRQWDLMSSGLMKGGRERVRSIIGGSDLDSNEAVSSTNIGTESVNTEASMTMSGTNVESGININNSNQQPLSKKAFVGSNTSIGRSNRDGNIPVRAVSPRVRWVEEKPQEHYGSQQITASQQDLALSANEGSWAMNRSPSRTLQQPIRAVSPRVRISNDNEELQKKGGASEQFGDVPTAGELLGRSHEELVLLLIQLRRRHTMTHRSIEQCCAQISSIEDCLSSLKAAEREESLQKLEQLKLQLMELENQYEKSKPLVQLVDNMVKLGSLYNRPGSTIERLERNQRLRQKVLAEHAIEQQRWLESAAAGKPLETEAARVRVAELWALEQELADEAAMIQGIKTDRNAIDSLLTGVRSKLDTVSITDKADSSPGLEAELARVHAMLAHNSKKLEQTVADNARLERELQQLRRALRARRARPPPAHPAHPQQHPTAMLEDEVTRVQQLVSALQRQRQELSRAVRHLTQQSHALQTTHDSMPGKRRSFSSWQETNLDTGHTIDHGQHDYDYTPQYQSVNTPLYVDTRPAGPEVTSPLSSEDMQHTTFGNLSNVEKQEIKTVRIVKRESERRQRDRERSLQPMTDWSSNITANLDQFLEEELVQPVNNYRSSSVPRTDYSKFEDYYSKGQIVDTQNYQRSDKNMEQSPKYPSSPSLSNYDYSKDISSLSSSYHRSYDRSGYDRTMSISTQYLNSPTDSARTLTNDPISKTSSIVSLTRSNMELSPIFKSEAAKQIITEMSGDGPKNGSLHRRQVPKEKRRHYTAPHHLSAKTLNDLPKDVYNQDVGARSLDDADMERVVRGAAPDVVRSACARTLAVPDSIDRLLAAPQKILIPERYIPEKPPELSPEEQQKRQEKVESIKKMLTSTSAEPNTKSPDGDEKRQREHLLQMNQILAKQVTEMSKIIAVKALEELPLRENNYEYEDRSPDVELPIYQQRENFFS